MADTSLFSIGCMKRQHHLTPFWLALLSSPSLFLLGQIISSPTLFVPFAFLDKKFRSPFPLFSSLRTKIFWVQLQFWRASVLKHEWILNCTTPTRFLGKKKWRYTDQISPRLLPWYLEVVLKSEIRIKYAENIPFSWNIQTIPFFELIRNSKIKIPFSNFSIQFLRKSDLQEESPRVTSRSPDSINGIR